MGFDLDFANNDFVKDVQDAGMHKYHFLLWPRRWRQFSLPTQITWQSQPFDETNVSSIPENPGVYAFCVEPRIIDGLKPCYLLYIGETSRTLRERYREYLRDAGQSESREKLYIALNLYKGYIHFFYAPTPPNISTLDVEKELLKAFLPPTNTRFPAEVKRIVTALAT
jgi:excinuclease UvrABC nuclease subunit